MSGLVIAFSGRISSGKSTLSQEVALALGLPRVSFGEGVRTAARRAGIPETRESLQALGESLVATDPIGFTRSVLAQTAFNSGTSLIVDGIRHVEVLSILRSLCAPSAVRMILLEVDDQLRYDRSRERGRAGDLGGAVDAHSTETQVSRLKSEADLVLNGGRPSDELVAIVRSHVLAEWAGT